MAAMWNNESCTATCAFLAGCSLWTLVDVFVLLLRRWKSKSQEPVQFGGARRAG